MKMPTMSLLVCAMVALTSAAAVPEAEKNVTLTLSDQVEADFSFKSASTCPGGWTQYYDHCFIYVSTLTTWADAEKNCQAQGGNLASVHSFGEQFQIQSMIFWATHGFAEAWLGGCDAAQEGTWFWSDGTHFDFTYWAEEQPDGSGNCLAMNYGGNHKYDDQPCDYQKPSVCAIRSDMC